MTSTMKKTLNMMRFLNPYKNYENAEVYQYLWESLKTLRNLDILSDLEWDRIYDLDREMFDKLLKSSKRRVTEASASGNAGANGYGHNPVNILEIGD